MQFSIEEDVPRISLLEIHRGSEFLGRTDSASIGPFPFNGETITFICTLHSFSSQNLTYDLFSSVYELFRVFFKYDI